MSGGSVVEEEVGVTDATWDVRSAEVPEDYCGLVSLNLDDPKALERRSSVGRQVNVARSPASPSRATGYPYSPLSKPRTAYAPIPTSRR